MAAPRHEQTRAMETGLPCHPVLGRNEEAFKETSSQRKNKADA